MKLQHRACKHGVKTAVRLPLSKCAINARVVNFWTAVLTSFDRQFFPLAAQLKQSQNVVEDHQQGQFRRWAPAPNGKMGQGKLPELLATQSRRNPLLLLTFRHFVPPKNGILDGVWRQQ